MNSNNQTTVLLVEDDPDDEALTLRALKKNNINNHIDVVHDGAEALDYLFSQKKYSHRQNDSLPELILLDLNLPKIGGHEVLRQLRNNDRTRHVPVVVFSSSKADQDIIDSYDNGVNSYIRKPVNVKQFTDAVEKISFYWLIINHNANITHTSEIPS